MRLAVSCMLVASLTCAVAHVAATDPMRMEIAASAKGWLRPASENMTNVGRGSMSNRMSHGVHATYPDGAPCYSRHSPSSTSCQLGSRSHFATKELRRSVTALTTAKSI